MKPSLDTWTIVFLFSAIQGIFLGIITLLQRSKNQSANIYLGVFVLLFSLMLLDYFTFWSNYRFIFPYSFGFSFGFQFWYGPVLYLYIRELNNLPSTWKSRSLHFIPGLLFYGTMIEYFSMPIIEKLEVFTAEETPSLFDFLLVPSLKIAHMTVYALLSYQTILKASAEQSNNGFFRWQKIFTALFAVFIFSGLTYYLLVSFADFKVEYDYMISFTMVLAIYTIGYIGYRHPEVIYGFESSRSKYENSSLKQEEAINLLEQITELLEYDKIYRRSDLKLPDVAKQLNTSAHHISQIVNERLKLSFPDLINSYRVNEAKTILANPLNSEQKIIGIAFDTGFNNKANFNNAFKKFTGMSPSDYRKLHQLEYMN